MANFIPVESSNIHSVCYVPEEQKLGIVFHSNTRAEYWYDGVSQDLFDSFVAADSLGSFFAKEIRPFPDRFPFVKVRR